TNLYHLAYIVQQISNFDPSMAQHISVIGHHHCDVRAKILLATSMHLQTIEHQETVREAARYISMPMSRDIISFIDTVQTMEELPNLRYHNPGKEMQHYFAFLSSQLPIYPIRQTLLMCLGDVVQQDRSKMLPELRKIFHPTQIAQLLGFISAQEAKDGLIYRFKMGIMDEETFDIQMIEAIAKLTQVTLSEETFNTIWQTMNPSFGEISQALKNLDAEKLREKGYELKFISYTNPKDIKRLREELHRHDQPYVMAHGHLIGFAGFDLTCSYVEQKSTLELIQDFLPKKPLSSAFTYGNQASPKPIFISLAPAEHSDLRAIEALDGVIVQRGFGELFSSTHLSTVVKNT
ncbi:MAG TPA: hypothetical protein VHD33_02510, partial [Legionellaceae bacterium]|nr:hypothetical protein [Legionellaceae bacterium]